MVTTRTIDDILDDLVQTPRLPRATYRIQFNPEFTFQDAQALIDYLHDLGISDLYTSPLFKPRSGSTHGYDTVDYNEFNPALGTEDDFNALVNALHERGMGLLLDIVPNHMGVNTENVWWMDVLKHGPSSEYAHYFDIDWRPQNRALDNKVLLPILGDHFGRVLEAGELELVYWHGDFYLHYYEHQFPITPNTYGDVLRRAEVYLNQRDDHEDWELLELASIIRSLDYLPPPSVTEDPELSIRRREQVIIRWRLLGLFDKSEAFRTALQAALDDMNGDVDDSASFDALDDLLQRQPYRLSYWRVATDEINYRRFFDINDMAAIRIESPEVFTDTHRLALRLLAEGRVNGLRIDHPDGLWDPEAYFQRLQEAYLNTSIKRYTDDNGEALVMQRLDNLRQSQSNPPEWPLYVLVEKILSETEPLPYEWAVYGTTGYDFMYQVNNLFVNSENETRFDQLYADFIGEEIDFHALIDSTKKLVMSQSLTSEIEARSSELARIVEQDRRFRGFTRNSIGFALSEIIAALPVYRTYTTSPGDVSERDRHYVEQAVEHAKRQNPLTPSSVFDFLRDILLMDNWLDFAEHLRPALREFVMKFQQITGPVMAKSVEDTAFYIYNRLTSLNEVGGHPDRFGIACAAFHDHNRDKGYPYTMLSTSTHDTKRSEDVRARINVLSEISGEWEQMLKRWATLNADAKTEVNGEPAPAANDEYLLYQSLLGAYPNTPEHPDSFRDRIIGYMLKAINEAKTHSNWINPNDAYAQAIGDFVTHILDNDTFMQAFLPFQQKIAYFGFFNSLSQVALKLTVPGIPDIYQGNELWDYSLVDPDNRRPVDFDHRRALLDAIQSDPAEVVPGLFDDLQGGAIKMYLTHRLLHLRRERDLLFLNGDYERVNAQGAKSDHVCAFLRRHEDEQMLVVVPRLIYDLMDGEMTRPHGENIWSNTQLMLPANFDAESLDNWLTGETVTVRENTLTVADALATFPVGVFLVRENTEMG